VVYKNNTNNCKNNFKSLNMHLNQPPGLNQRSNLRPHKKKYMGSIDDSVDEINKSVLLNNSTSNGLLNGHRELNKNENNDAPAGNIADRTDTSTPYAPPIPIYKESNIDSLDYDERNSFQSLSRNDPLRPIIGIMGREAFMDPFLREELENTEAKEWWGNGEY